MRRALAVGVAAVLLASIVAASQARSQDVLLSDDFSASSSEWGAFDTAAGRARVENGAMLVRANTGYGSVFADYSQTFGDVVVEVDMALVGGTDDNWQSVSCRFAGNSFYDLGISADGYYIIDVWVDGVKSSSSLGPTRSSDIRVGPGAVNRVRAECVGDLLRLSVNGRQLAELRDGSHASGLISLSVQSLDAAYSDVAFDNLVVTRP
jgi:hypothetical protein